MKFVNFASLVRNLTDSDTTSFSNADLVLFSNIAKDDISEFVADFGEDYFDITQTANLVAGEREYPFPDDMLKNVKLVEVNLTGNSGDWKRVDEFDLNSYRQRQSIQTKPFNDLDIPSSFSDATTDEATIIDTFSDINPSYDIDGQAIFLYTGSAIIAVTAGLQLKAMIYPLDYTTDSFTDAGDKIIDMSVRPSSTSTAMPRPTHLPMAFRTSILFKESNNMPIGVLEAQYEVELAKMKGKLKNKNLDRSITPRVSRDTGFNY